MRRGWLRRRIRDELPDAIVDQGRRRVQQHTLG